MITVRLAGLIGAIPTRAGILPRWQVDRFTDQLKAHLSQAMALAGLVESVGLSEVHLCRSFKRSNGLSPFQRQLSPPIGRAKELLSKPDTVINATTAACGYSQQAHFAKLFHRVVRVTPSA